MLEIEQTGGCLNTMDIKLGYQIYSAREEAEKAGLTDRIIGVAPAEDDAAADTTGKTDTAKTDTAKTDTTKTDTSKKTDTTKKDN